MSGPLPPLPRGRRAFLRLFGGTGALLVLSSCTSPNNSSKSPVANGTASAGTPTAPRVTPALGTPAATGTAGATTSPGASPAAGTSPTAGRVVGAAALPKPPPTPGGTPPTPIGVTPASTAAAPVSTPGSNSGGAPNVTGSRTTPVSQNAATGTAVPGSNRANAAPITSPTAAPTPKPSVTVTITAEGKFNPANVTVNVGQAVMWVNDGRYPQTVTDNPTLALNKSHAALPNGAKPWDSGILNFKQNFVHTFDVAGDYQYFSIPFESKGVVGKVTVK